ncbi:MAG: prephenate dehydratase [Blastocatellia bacterium AA13]|nr:MAG: prephenate dehydratase [Blastocatellia bacterium AA13]
MSLKVAYQGERGAFSEAAVRKILGEASQPVPYRSFEEMFESAASGETDCLLAPIENSLAGSVLKNYDLLERHELTIVGETYLRIAHSLIAPRGVKIADVRRVYSHPVALAQCERFLRANPRMEVAQAYDTAGSVKMVVQEGRSDEAAIAGRSAAEVYGADVLAEGIEDHAQNYTRFLLISDPSRIPPVHETASASNGKKTTIIFRVANKPGALFRSLAVFALRDIDLSKIESRPIEGRPWEYSFYLDLIGDVADSRIRKALAHLEELAESLRILGCYERAQSIHLS